MNLNISFADTIGFVFTQMVIPSNNIKIKLCLKELLQTNSGMQTKMFLNQHLDVSFCYNCKQQGKIEYEYKTNTIKEISGKIKHKLANKKDP